MKIIKIKDENTQKALEEYMKEINSFKTGLKHLSNMLNVEEAKMWEYIQEKFPAAKKLHSRVDLHIMELHIFDELD